MHNPASIRRAATGERITGHAPGQWYREQAFTRSISVERPLPYPVVALIGALVFVELSGRPPYKEGVAERERSCLPSGNAEGPDSHKVILDNCEPVPLNLSP